MRKYLILLCAVLCINLLRCSNGSLAFSRKDIHFMEKRPDGVYLTPFFPDQSAIELPHSAEVIRSIQKDPQQVRFINKPKPACFVSQYNTLECIQGMFYYLKDEAPFKTITLELFPVVKWMDEGLDSAIAKERLRQDMFLLIKNIGYFCSQVQVKTELAFYGSYGSNHTSIDVFKQLKINPLVSDLYMQFDQFVENNKPKCLSKSIMMMEGLCILYLLICCWQVEVCGRQGFSFGLQRIAALVGAGFGTVCLLNDINDVYVDYEYLERCYKALEKHKQDWLKILNAETSDKDALAKFNNLFSDIQEDTNLANNNEVYASLLKDDEQDASRHISFLIDVTDQDYNFDLFG